MSNYMTKVDEGHADEVLLSDIEGNAVPSGVKIGGANLTGSDTVLATEQAVKNYAEEEMVSKDQVVSSMNISNPSDKLISERAFLEAMQIIVVD